MDTELLQQSKNGDQKHFKLKAGREIHVTQNINKKTQYYAFSILALLSEGKRNYNFKKRWLLLGLVSMVSILLIPQFEDVIGLSLHNYYIYIFAALLCSALLFLLLFVRSFSSSYVFYSIHTRLPLVEFWPNKPNRSEYSDFINNLQNNIKTHQEEMHISYKRQLAGEIRTLRRIAEAGTLSMSVYQAAKAKLLIMSDVEPHFESKSK